MKQLAKDLCPPLLWRALGAVKEQIKPAPKKLPPKEGQDLDLYWDEDMAQLLETWGDGNTWSEIQLLLCNVQGTVLDIACGTGKETDLLAPYKGVEIHGCDISDFLIGKAIARGIPKERLTVCDATKLPYANGQFDYSFSIGSLEHFTIDGIDKALAEAARVTRVGSYHMMPTSRSGKDEGWLKTNQSFHNSSPQWWVEKFEKHFKSVRVLDSKWEDTISVGSWFICHQ